ncbi:MAG: aspartate ammonia-lyase [Sedimentisphaerales bacterium]|nr:aspartate ammonia-lyase [Sedimentisphaerales bacterium]
MAQERNESDLLGQRSIPADMLYGIHTLRALENFPLSNRLVHAQLIRAYGTVKTACLQICIELNGWNNQPCKAKAILQACKEMAEGKLDEYISVDALQGGAGTSLNMNVNEALANRALQIMQKPLGSYDIISPTEDINRYQSTNDTFPTALRLACIKLIQKLEQELVALQEAFQQKEKQFAHIVKVGRTQFQDAVLTTLGREMGAYAEALNRDRWRIYKCQERLRVINLGATAIGTGLGAERQYIFRVTDRLREITGIGFARAENLVDGTQNADVFVEVSGILKASAATLWKICSDLRFLSSGPDAGIDEIRLPLRQAGSSIMPGKVNPVIPEAVTQASMMITGYDQVITMACAAGSLELNPFLPLVADCLLNGIDLLANACNILRQHCIEGIEANEEVCRRHVENSTATATALVAPLGYEEVTKIVQYARESGKTIRQVVLEQNILTSDQYDSLLSPEAVCRLGFVKNEKLPKRPAQ